ncbi:MAG: serine hydrolase domain-containing protein [Caulobacter sp.]
MPLLSRRATLAALPAVTMGGLAMGTGASPAPSADLSADLATLADAAERDPLIGRTDALLVIRDGRPLLERYGPDHGPSTPHVSWSMAKSVTHALVGCAVLQGRIGLDDPVRRLARSGAAPIRVRHLLNLVDGLPWDEFRRPLATRSDATRLLFGDGRFDVAAYAASRPGPRRLPGSRWNYSTGSFHILAAELTDRLFPDARDPRARRAAVADWMTRSLFRPAGMRTALFEYDPAGTFYGGSLMWASVHDFARLGQLYLDDGIFGGRRLLPAGWNRFAAAPTVEPTYGAGWWREGRPGPGAPPSLMSGAFGDSFHARGLDGQILMLVPSRRLIIVRLANMPDNDRGWPLVGALMRRLIAASQTANI